MKSLTTTLLGAAAVACLAFQVPPQDTRPQDENARRIETLSRALDAEVRRSADLEKRFYTAAQRVTDLERRIDQIDAWFVTVRTASALLDLAADDARRNGFEQAGPNALARTNILEGMKGFAAEITRAVPTGVEVVPR